MSEKEAIILMGHGSRVPGAAKDMEQVAERLRGEYDHVEICFMSGLGPLFGEAFEKCVNRGAERVIVIPYFLHEGMHLRVDIPEMMRQKARDFPQVKLILGKHLGFDESLATLVLKRIKESENLCDVREMEGESKEAILKEVRP